MDYGKLQAKRYLDKSNSNYKPKKLNWEQREELRDKKRKDKKHQQYIASKRRKQNQHKGSAKKFIKILSNMNYKQVDQNPSKFINTIDNINYKQANKDGMLTANQIYHNLRFGTFIMINNRTMSLSKPLSEITYKYKVWWLKVQNNKSSAYVKSYDKDTLSNSAYNLFNLFEYGFLDSVDIKYDLGLNNIRNANRMLKPTTKFSSMILFKKDTNHISADKLFKVSHLIQYVHRNGKKVKRTYGVNKPVTVVSIKDYLQFLRINYRSNHLTSKYAKDHLNKLGMKLYKACQALTPQQKMHALMNYAIDDIYNQSAKIIPKSFLPPLITSLIWNQKPYSSKSKLMNLQDKKTKSDIKINLKCRASMSINTYEQALPAIYNKLVKDSNKECTKLKKLKNIK